MLKVLYYLSFLSKPAIKRFQLFVSSPYFNRKQDLISLLDVLILSINKAEEEGHEEKAFKRWKPGKPFNKNQFRKSCSALTDLYVQFIGQENYQDNPVLARVYQLRAMNDSGANKYFTNFFEHVEKELEEKFSQMEVNDFWIQAEIYDAQIIHDNLRPQREEVPAIQLASDSLDQYYLLQKLKYHISLLAQNQIVGAAVPSFREIDLTSLYQTLALSNGQNPFINAYYLLLLAYRHRDQETYYLQLKSLLKGGLEDVDTMELRNLINGVINFTVSQARMGIQSFRDEIEDLYQILVDREIIWINGKILAWDVANLTFFHLEKGNYDWVHIFIEKCKNRLIPSQSTQVNLFCNGLMAYYQKDYATARNAFDRLLTKFDDVFYGLNIRVAKARLLYEIKDDELEYLLDAAPKYIRSKHISDSHKLLRLNFFRFLKRLWHTSNFDQVKLKRLKEEIRSEKKVSSKKWLLQQISGVLES